MRVITAFLFLFVAVASASVVRDTHQPKTADQQFLVRQKNLLHLYYHVHQPNTNQDQIDIAKTYSIESNMDKYTDSHIVKSFLNRYKIGMLPRGRTFSLAYPELVEQSELLFELLYHAKDYQTFYKTACWAREHVNEQMYIYALTTAVIHRRDCEGLFVPPPYEITPNYYFSSEVIDKAYQVKMQGHGHHISDDVHHVDDHTVLIYANYSNWYQNYNREQALSYFTEDVGLNTYYYYHHLDYPFWMEGEKYGLKKDGRGEMYYYVHQQILARYYLERLSNGLGEIPRFSWQWPIETGYYPSLKYHNGIHFPQRPNHYDLKQGENLPHLVQVHDYERRIRDAIDMGYINTPQGTKVPLTHPEDIETLASIIESNVDCPNPRYYKYSPFIAKMLLGTSHRPLSEHKIYPSTLELYATSLRDPMFYQLYKKYVHYFTHWKNMLTPYTKQELVLPGVKIETVEVDKLVTYFDHWDTSITNVISHTPEEVKAQKDDIIVKARLTRLNHLPFTVTTNVMSEKATKVVFRYFIGPKYDGKGDLIPFEQNRENLFELDQFVYDLKSGKNVVQRHSRDFWINVQDFTPSREIYEHVNMALEGKKPYTIDNTNEHNSFPDRLLLPKGRKGGMPFVFYVVISPYIAPKVEYGTGYDQVISTGVGSGARRLDGYPLGYPFDRHVEDHVVDSIPNIHESTVLIFHKQESDINKAH